MKVDELQKKVTDIVTNLFPNSFFRTEVSRLGGSHRPSVIGHFALGKDQTEWANGIIHNDNSHTVFLIHCVTEEDNIIFAALRAGIYGVRTKDFKLNKLGWRNLSEPTSPEIILKAIEKYFKNMKDFTDEV